MLAVVLILTLTAHSVLAVCDSGWVSFDDSCYFYGHENESWEDALKICKEKDGWLVYNDNEENNIWIVDHTHEKKTDTVAFTAVFDSDRDIEGGANLIFNKVLLNVGSGYDNKTGIFTAPSSGIYVFHIYGLTKKSSDFLIDLIHNQEYVVSAFARQGSDFDAAGNSVTQQLKKNDTVYVRARARRNAYLFGRPDEIYATFSGYLIGLLRESDVVSMCPSGWLPKEGCCYLVSEEALTFYKAVAYCNEIGSSLMQITSQAKQDTIADVLKPFQKVDYLWIGGNNEINVSQWEWIPSLQPFVYTNWEPGEPNYHETERCVYIYTIKKTWINAACNRSHRFICEKCPNVAVLK